MPSRPGRGGHIFRLLTVVLCTCSIPVTLTAQEQEMRVVVDFIEGEGVLWSIVNDGVMGGRSTSKISLTDERTALFTGFVSLENNGDSHPPVRHFSPWTFPPTRGSPSGLKEMAADISFASVRTGRLTVWRTGWSSKRLLESGQRSICLSRHFKRPSGAMCPGEVGHSTQPVFDKWVFSLVVRKRARLRWR